jgi:hypothetical protein
VGTFYGLAFEKIHGHGFDAVVRDVGVLDYGGQVLEDGTAF